MEGLQKDGRRRSKASKGARALDRPGLETVDAGHERRRKLGDKGSLKRGRSVLRGCRRVRKLTLSQSEASLACS